MASFGFTYGQEAIDKGTVDLDADTFTLYVCEFTWTVRTTSSLATVLATTSPITGATGYSNKTFTFTIAINGTQSQRRMPNQSWNNVQSGFDCRSVVIGYPSLDIPIAHFEVSPQVTTNGFDMDLTLPNNTFLANVL